MQLKQCVESGSVEWGCDSRSVTRLRVDCKRRTHTGSNCCLIGDRELSKLLKPHKNTGKTLALTSLYPPAMMKWQKTASYERLKCIEHVLAATQYWRRFHEDLMLIHWLFTLIWRQCSAATANQADVTRACATQRRVCDVISRWAGVALQMRAIKIWRPICGRIQKRRATDASARFTQRRATHDVVTSQRWIAFMTSRVNEDLTSNDGDARDFQDFRLIPSALLS